MNDAAIKVRNVSKRFVTEEGDSFVALAGANLDIGSTEFVSLIGPSGCGKTTLLKLIDGLITPSEGTLEVLGRQVDGPGEDRAVVFQNFALLPWLSVRDNVAFGLRMRGMGKPERLERADALIRQVGLDGFGDRFPRQLSGGMQQRVGLARAMAVDPKVLLMDEPFSAVDAQTRNVLQTDLLRLWDESPKAVVFVTHAMDEAVFLADRVVIMATRPGRIAEEVEIDLPRPRTDEMRKDARFVELTAYVWQRLKEIIEAESVVTT